MLHPWEIPASPPPFLPRRIPAPDFSIIRVPSRAPLRRGERIWAGVTNFTSASRGALGSATDTLAYGSAVTAGDFLFVEIRMGTGATLNTVSDSINAGNWILSANTDNVGRQYFAYKENSGAGTPTLTFTFSASGQSPRYAMGEVTNTIGAGSFDASDILATGTSTALLANAQTGATATYIQIGLMSISANETFTQNGAWTIAGVEPAAGTSRLAVVYQELTSSASRAPAVDCGASSTWIAFSFMVKQNAAAVTFIAPRVVTVPIAPDAPAQPTLSRASVLAAIVSSTRPGVPPPTPQPVPGLTVTGPQPSLNRSAPWIAAVVLATRPGAPPPTPQPVPGPAVAGIQPNLNSDAPWIDGVARVTLSAVFTRWPQPVPQLSVTGPQLVAASAYIVDQGQPVAPVTFVPTATPRPPQPPTTGPQPTPGEAWLASVTADVVLGRVPPSITAPSSGPQPLFDAAAWIADQGQPAAVVVLGPVAPRPPAALAIAAQPGADPAAWMATAADVILRSWPQAFTPLDRAAQPLLDAAALIADQGQPAATVIIPRRWPQLAPELAITGRQPIALPLAAWVAIAPILVSTDGRVDATGAVRTLLAASASARTILTADGAPRTIIVIEARRVN